MCITCSTNISPLIAIGYSGWYSMWYRFWHVSFTLYYIFHLENSRLTILHSLIWYSMAYRFDMNCFFIFSSYTSTGAFDIDFSSFHHILLLEHSILIFHLFIIYFYWSIWYWFFIFSSYTSTGAFDIDFLCWSLFYY